MVTGTIAGLASITPAAGSVDPLQALLIGAISGILCQEVVNLVRNILRIDDTLDVFAVHGVGGVFGTLMIGFFGYASILTQLSGLVIVGIFTIIVTYTLIKITALITPLRVDEETETNGLDLSIHGERAYDVNS
jgi:Amt family ammonium transporter